MNALRCGKYIYVYTYTYTHTHTHTHTHTYTMEYYSAIKNNEILPFVTTWIDLEGIMLSEVSQIEKDKSCITHLYVESKNQNKWTNITKQKQSHRYREQIGGLQKGGVWGEGRNRWGELRGANSLLKNKCHEYEMYSVGNIANN